MKLKQQTYREEQKDRELSNKGSARKENAATRRAKAKSFDME